MRTILYMQVMYFFRVYNISAADDFEKHLGKPNSLDSYPVFHVSFEINDSYQLVFALCSWGTDLTIFFCLFYSVFYWHFKTIKVTLQTNKTDLIILAICWLYMRTFIMLNLDHKYLSSFVLITSYFLFIYSRFCYHTSA